MKTTSAKKSVSVARGSRASKVSQEWVEILDRVVSNGERVILRRRSKQVAAVVPIEDLKRLEELEDRQDVEYARAALEEMRRTGAKPVPWSRVKTRAGL